MPASAPQRQFTAEIRKRTTFPPAPQPGETADETAAVRHRELMLALDDIRCLIAGTAAATAPSSAPRRGADAGGPGGAGGLETAILLQELQALEGAIAETKREIAALRQLGKPPATLATATNELDAVVHATESATECILAASERIDERVGCLRNQAADAFERAGIEDISEQVTRIFEACNFQDITGQRITKVVNAMKFIEERVERMIEILGGAQAFAGVDAPTPPPPGHAVADEADLLDQHKISQDAIDAFFN